MPPCRVVNGCTPSCRDLHSSCRGRGAAARRGRNITPPPPPQHGNRPVHSNPAHQQPHQPPAHAHRVELAAVARAARPLICVQLALEAQLGAEGYRGEVGRSGGGDGAALVCPRTLTFVCHQTAAHTHPAGTHINGVDGQLGTPVVQLQYHCHLLARLAPAGRGATRWGSRQEPGGAAGGAGSPCTTCCAPRSPAPAHPAAPRPPVPVHPHVGGHGAAVDAAARHELQVGALVHADRERGHALPHSQHLRGAQGLGEEAGCVEDGADLIGDLRAAQGEGGGGAGGMAAAARAAPLAGSSRARLSHGLLRAGLPPAAPRTPRRRASHQRCWARRAAAQRRRATVGAAAAQGEGGEGVGMPAA